jgi:hypothetical protein
VGLSGGLPSPVSPPAGVDREIRSCKLIATIMKGNIVYCSDTGGTLAAEVSKPTAGWHAWGPLT